MPDFFLCLQIAEWQIFLSLSSYFISGRLKKEKKKKKTRICSKHNMCNVQGMNLTFSYLEDSACDGLK